MAKSRGQMVKRLLLCLVLGCLQIQPVVANEQSVKVPGTRVFLSPPEGFAPSNQFTGLVNKAAEASLVVTEIHGPYDKVISSFSQKEMALKGMNLTASSLLTVGKGQGSQGSIIEFTQTIAGQKFKKVTAIFGDQSNTTIVSGSMPDSGAETLLESLKQAVKSARFDAHARLANLDEGLPFTIGDTKKLKKASRLQNILLFTTTGRPDGVKDNGAIFAVGQSLGEVPSGNREAFAKEKLQHTPQVKNVTIDKGKTIQQSDLSGEEFTGKGADSADGRPMYVFQTVLFDKDCYYILQGLCPMSERAVYEPEYQQLVKNFQLR